MSWAALAAKNKDKPVPASKPQIVHSKEIFDGNMTRGDDAAPVHADPEQSEPEPTPASVAAAEAEALHQKEAGRKTLVLDTGGLIKGSAGLATMAEEFITIDDVLAEVRDQKTKEFVESFPFELVLREPSRDAMREVIRVAKQTGDFGTLSAVDLRMIGMAYQVAKERGALAPPPPVAEGTFRKKPKISMAKKTAKEGTATNLPGWGSWGTKEEPKKDDAGDDDDEEEEKEKDDCVMRVEQGEEEEVGTAEDEKEAKEEDGGWITPANIRSYNAAAYTKFSEDEEGRNVGCMTTDFAAQNVLMHLGVLVVSVEGYRVRHLKKWVLRCHGCFAIVKDTTKQFCPDCGSGDTLKRCSYSVNEKGEEEVWINPRRRINVRGTVYNLPKPRGGRHGTNKTMVLREDQLLHCGKKSNADQKRDDLVASLLSEDWMFAAGTRDKKTAHHIMPSKSSYSRKNPNAGRRRKL